MIKKNIGMSQTSIKQNSSREGEHIEDKINRIVNNKEPITDGAPLLYTDRKDGVRPSYDIRTDKFEVAIEAMQKVSEAHTTKRAERIKERLKKDEPETKPDNGSEPATE